MDINPMYTSPPPAHKPIQEIVPSNPVAPVPEVVTEAPLDLSTRPRSRDDYAPLDLTVSRPSRQEAPSIRSNTGTTENTTGAQDNKGPVNDGADDDVIVVGVQQGRKFTPPSTHHIPMRRSKHDLRHQMLLGKAPDLRQFPPGVTPRPMINTDKTKALFNMCKKETYTGGVAYSPFDLNTGLMRLKQMLMMAKDPQQAKQLAHSFQKMALTALLKSRLQQQQRAGVSSPSAAAGTAIRPQSSNSLGTSPASSPASTVLGGTSPITIRTPPLGTSPASIGTPPPSVSVGTSGGVIGTPPSSGVSPVPFGTPLSAGDNPALLGISSLSISGDTTTVSPASTSSTTTTTSSVQPVTVQPLGSPPISLGSTPLTTVTNTDNIPTIQKPTFVMSQQSLSFDPSSAPARRPDDATANNSTSTRGSPASPAVNKGASDSPAGNFESEYMKYVRSKRFLSGGSDITAEKHETQPQQQASSKRGEGGSGKKQTRPSITDYQYIIAEINKVTKSALQMAENMYRKRQGLPETGKLTPPPAHTKVNINTVDPKKPHLNMLKGHHRLMMSRMYGHDKGVFKQGHKNLVTSIKPEDLPDYLHTHSKPSHDMPPLQQTFIPQDCSKSGGTQHRGITWTPPIGSPELFSKSARSTKGTPPPTVDLTGMQAKGMIWTPPVSCQDQQFIKANNKQQASDLTQECGSDILRVPKYHSNDDAKEMISAYGDSSDKVGDDGQQSTHEQVQNYPIPEVKPIEITPESPEQLHGNMSADGTVSYQCSRSLSGGTVSTPTLIAGGSTTDLNSPGQHKMAPPFPCMSPNGSTVVKPVTSTFIGWNVSGYKRIPVANVNPIKVKGGENQYLDVTPISSSQQLPLVGQPAVLNPDINQLNRHLPSQLTSVGSKDEGKDNRYQQQSTDYFITPHQQEQTVQLAQHQHTELTQQNPQHYRPPNTLAVDIRKGRDNGSQQNEADLCNKMNPSSNSIPGIDNFEIPVIQGHIRPMGIMGTPTTLKAQRKGHKDEMKPKKSKKMRATKIGASDEVKGSKESTKIRIKSGKVKSSSKSVESKTEAIKAILRGGMSLLPSYVNESVENNVEEPTLKMGKKRTKEKGKGVNFHSSDDEIETKTEKQDVNDFGDNILSENISTDDIHRKKLGKRKRRKRGDGLTKPVKVKKIKLENKSKALDGTEITEVGDGELNTEQHQEGKWQAEMGERSKVRKKKRGRKAKDKRSARYRMSELYTYNKNAKYEEELVREEERKLLLRVRRQARRSTTTSQEENGFDNEASKDGSYQGSDVNGDSYAITENTATDFNNLPGLDIENIPAEPEVDIVPELPRKALKRKKLMGTKVAKMFKRQNNVFDLEPVDGITEPGSGDHTHSTDSKKLKKRRRKRWYKKRKQQPQQYVQYPSEYCMGEVDESFNTYSQEAVDYVIPEALPAPDLDLHVPCVDPVLLSELKGIVVCRETGETKLQRLTRMGHEDLAVRCIEAGLFDVNGRDHAGYTALHKSCVTGRLKVAKALLASGAIVDAAALDGTRPIHDAVDNHRLELVRLLLSYGADPRTSTYSGKTPIKIARMPDMRELLTGHLQDINGPQSGDTVQPWTFSLTSEQKHFDQLGFDIFCNLPSDQESEEEDVDFEFWEKEPLEYFHICLDPEVGPRNYYLLLEIVQLKEMPKEDFKLINFDLSYKTLTKLEALEICEIYYPVSKDKIEFLYRDKEEVEFVESNALLQSILEVETTVISAKDIKEHGHLHDNSFTETPVERVVVCENVESKSDIDRESSNTSKSCSRKLMFIHDQLHLSDEDTSKLENVNDHYGSKSDEQMVPVCLNNSMDEPLPVLEKVTTGNEDNREKDDDEKEVEVEEKQHKTNDDMPCLTLCV